jgi:2-polyprenyl-3-methyl-5-hydroxy-6-metoxy-1,4-benzoquinol methylase
MKSGARIAASPCGLCGGTERQVLATRGRGYVPLTTAVCLGCGLVSHHPAPDPAEVAAFYASHYRVAYKGGYEPKRKHALRALRGAITRAHRVASRLRPGGRVLDVGASSGEFTHVVARFGFAARGIEPNHGYADFARRSYGAMVETGGIEDASVEAGSLDLVTLSHVVEHLADPWDALRRVHGWLGADGLLFVEVPNLAGVRKQAANTFHTAHIWNFTPETLLLLAWQCGFVPVDGEDTSHTSFVMRKRHAADQAPIGAGPGLAARLTRQVATEGRQLAYLLSGSPLTRRMARLRRNFDEWRVCSRHATVRAMADAILNEASPNRPRLPRSCMGAARAAAD